MCRQEFPRPSFALFIKCATWAGELCELRTSARSVVLSRRQASMMSSLGEAPWRVLAVRGDDGFDSQYWRADLQHHPQLVL